MERENRKRRIICGGVFEGLVSETRDNITVENREEVTQKKKKIVNRLDSMVDSLLDQTRTDPLDSRGPSRGRTHELFHWTHTSKLNVTRANQLQEPVLESSKRL